MTDPNNQDEQAGMADDWASAFAEQTAAEQSSTEDSGADDWGDAMAEQAATEEPQGASGQATSAENRVFKPLETGGATAEPRELDMIMEIPITLSVELGQTRLTIRELLDLAQGSVVELEGLAGEPMDVLVNGYLIAQGEIVVVDDKYGIRITEIVNRAERIHKLNR